MNRIGAQGAAANSVTFAAYRDPPCVKNQPCAHVPGSFGWAMRSPGHGYVLVNGNRPLDAAAAAPLSASGAYGPELVIDDPSKLPGSIVNFFLELRRARVHAGGTHGRRLRPWLGDRRYKRRFARRSVRTGQRARGAPGKRDLQRSPRVHPESPRVRLASAGSSGGRTQGGCNTWKVLPRPRTMLRADPPPPDVRGGFSDGLFSAGRRTTGPARRKTPPAAPRSMRRSSRRPRCRWRCGYPPRPTSPRE